MTSLVSDTQYTKRKKKNTYIYTYVKVCGKRKQE